jgi:dipeptidase E
MRLLLISNSTNPGEDYLDYPKHNIQKFLGEKPVNALFIPYAGVTVGYDDYAARVQSKFQEIGHSIVSIHNCKDPLEAVKNAEAIVVGGGNTFQLINMVHQNKLVEAIREKVLAGTPYIGWSAGSNLACPTIRTTNDMPIVEPPSFDAFNLIPFQINPHYLDSNPEGHAGETREMRINEFIAVNKNITVAGLREGCMFLFENGNLCLIGKRTVRIFRYGQNPVELSSLDDLNFLMKENI